MARYKEVDRSPRFLPVVLDAQLMAGSFEYALDYLIDNEIDLSSFDARYNNDDTGAPAYDPAVMLKIVLLAYKMTQGCGDQKSLTSLWFLDRLQRTTFVTTPRAVMKVSVPG